jgi:hypothetical protein
MALVYPNTLVSLSDKHWAWARSGRDLAVSPDFVPPIDVHGDNSYRGHVCEAGFWRLFPKSYYMGVFPWMRPSYDFLTMSYSVLHGGNPRCDVKARGIKGFPRDNYWVNVTARDCERSRGCIYSFAFVETRPEEPTRVWLVGWMGVDEFIEGALFLDKGDIQPDNPNKFEILEPRYSMQIRDLEGY